jgi:hypothetical protein
MSLDRNISGTWKGRGRSVSKRTSPMIGIVYKSNDILGMFVEDLDEYVILLTKEKQRKKVLKKSLKVVAYD